MGGVSRETAERLDTYVQELERWQGAVNLVGLRGRDDLWGRHIADCLQLSDLMPGSEAIVDLGSGAGLPGLVLAASHPSRRVELIESDQRKAAFLLSASHRMGVNTTIHCGRIEAVLPRLGADIGWVTARALAPLARLLDYAQPLLSAGAFGVFPKGRSYEAELTQARESWRFEAELHRSVTDPESRIIRIGRFEGRQ